MNRVQKQQLLRDMGIDVWRARTQAPVAGVVADPVAELEVDPVAELEVVPVAEPFKVVCLASERVVVLLEITDPVAFAVAETVTNTRRIRRFGGDLLASVAGDWQKTPRETVFTWPRAGLAATEREGKKALSAFVDKQLAAGSVKKIVLISESLSKRLQGVSWPDATVVVPPIDQLMRHGQLKRKLWLDLQKLTI